MISDNETSLFKKEIFIIIDRLVKKDYKDVNNNDAKRLKDSISLAYKIGK
ncbi:MAG: hypothetical protein LBD88_01125 [Candidatus Peribacteria bacterium]|jgi:hypothetical protein|nr:hypothetical protein [Candidatus Peribacteria bacterium]